MNPAIWLWQYLEAVAPEKTVALGLEVPFGEVVTRAVKAAGGKCKRSVKPGVIIWKSQRKNGVKLFANLVEETVVFEKPRSRAAKEITAAMEGARQLLPADLDAYTERTVLGWGGVHLLGPLWLVPPDPAMPTVLGMLRSLPGAAIASLPIDSPDAAREVLALMAGRLRAESGRVVAESNGVRRETLRRRLQQIRQQAEGVSRLADMFGADLTALGEILLDAERAVQEKLGIRRYSPQLSFEGGGGEFQEPVQPIAQPEPEIDYDVDAMIEAATPVVMQQAGESGETYRKPGDPEPTVPVLKTVAQVALPGTEPARQGPNLEGMSERAIRSLARKKGINTPKMTLDQIIEALHA